MNRFVTTAFLLVGLIVPAFAANAANPDANDVASGYMYPAKHHWAVDDTVGNCGVIDAKPSPYDISGLNILGDKSGYKTIKAAKKAYNSTCKGSVPRFNA
jgi:hypothetical protein